MLRSIDPKAWDKKDPDWQKAFKNLIECTKYYKELGEDVTCIPVASADNPSDPTGDVVPLANGNICGVGYGDSSIKVVDWKTVLKQTLIWGTIFSVTFLILLMVVSPYMSPEGTDVMSWGDYLGMVFAFLWLGAYGIGYFYGKEIYKFDIGEDICRGDEKDAARLQSLNIGIPTDQLWNAEFPPEPKVTIMNQLYDLVTKDNNLDPQELQQILKENDWTLITEEEVL